MLSVLESEIERPSSRDLRLTICKVRVAWRGPLRSEGENRNSYTIVPAPLGIEPNTIKYLRPQKGAYIIYYVVVCKDDSLICYEEASYGGRLGLNWLALFKPFKRGYPH